MWLGFGELIGMCVVVLVLNVVWLFMMMLGLCVFVCDLFVCFNVRKII